MTPSERLAEVEEILTEAKRLSRRYKEITGKPLGITGEVAEFEAAKRLGLDLAPVRSSGYDAIRKEEAAEVLIQIKGRSYAGTAVENGQRIGKLDFNKKWDRIVLVLLDDNYEVKEIIEAPREKIERRIQSLPVRADGKLTHTQQGKLTVSMLRSISRQS